ncbi:Ferredoxin [Prochlorococcus sp. MIT 0602]|nr:Ferredoxin [Prochlorococcus sp. MIT 0602]
MDCIKQRDGKNQKGTNFYFIEFSKCIDCGVCLAVCPIQGAVIPEERANEQKTYK